MSKSQLHKLRGYSKNSSAAFSTMIKYLVYPDYVISKNDNDKHFISGSKLIKLYNVNKEECKIVTNETDLNGLKGTFFILRPKYNGDYELDKCKKIYLN